MLKTPEPPKERQLEADLLQALLYQLDDVPFLTVEEIRCNLGLGGREIDLAVDLRLSGKVNVLLLGEGKGRGEPRIARAAVDQLFYLTHRTCPGAYGVFLAPHI